MSHEQKAKFWSRVLDICVVTAIACLVVMAVVCLVAETVLILGI